MTNQLLEFSTLLTTGLTAGAGIYVSLVIHPSWHKTSVKTAVENFDPVFHGSALSQAIFSTIGIIGGIVLGVFTGNILWYIGSALMIFSIPFTLFILMPINNKLLGNKGELTDEKAKELFNKWGNLQWIRTFVACAAFVLFLWVAIFK